jgi:hypothetical protein
MRNDCTLQVKSNGKLEAISETDDFNQSPNGSFDVKSKSE